MTGCCCCRILSHPVLVEKDQCVTLSVERTESGLNLYAKTSPFQLVLWWPALSCFLLSLIECAELLHRIGIASRDEEVGQQEQAKKSYSFSFDIVLEKFRLYFPGKVLPDGGPGAGFSLVEVAKIVAKRSLLLPSSLSESVSISIIDLALASTIFDVEREYDKSAFQSVYADWDARFHCIIPPFSMSMSGVLGDKSLGVVNDMSVSCSKIAVQLAPVSIIALLQSVSAAVAIVRGIRYFVVLLPTPKRASSPSSVARAAGGMNVSVTLSDWSVLYETGDSVDLSINGSSVELVSSSLGGLNGRVHDLGVAYSGQVSTSVVNKQLMEVLKSATFGRTASVWLFYERLVMIRLSLSSHRPKSIQGRKRSGCYLWCLLDST